MAKHGHRKPKPKKKQVVLGILGMLMATLVMMGATVEIPGTIRLKYDDEQSIGVETFADLRVLDMEDGFLGMIANLTISPAPQNIHLDKHKEGVSFSIINQEVLQGVWRGQVIVLDYGHVWEPSETIRPWVMKLLYTPDEVALTLFTIDITSLDDEGGYPIGNVPISLFYYVDVGMPPISEPD